MKILSPIPAGSGAHVLHTELSRCISGYRVRPFSPWWTLLPPALPAFSSDRVDLIHSHADYGAFFKRPRVPLVVTAHGYMLDRFMRAYSSPLQYLHYRTDLRLFVRMSLAMADQVVAVSRFVADMLRQDLGFRGRVRVIHNGVDSERFSPAKTPRRAGPFRVLYCGNLKRAKRPDLLVPLANALGRGFEIQYTAGLVGGGLLKGRLAGDAAELRCLGNVAHRDMPVLYQSVDALFMPSVREGFGLCVVEAMACGLPVVAADASALPELVHPEKGGYLQAIDDVAAFARSLRQLTDVPELARNMGQYNRAVVEQRFTLERMVADYRQLFEETLDTGSRR